MVDNKNRRGFAGMNSQQQREIASSGGKAAQASGKAHRFTSEEARAAGSKGGVAVSQDREHMSRIGRLGGQKRARNPRQSPNTQTSTEGT